MINKFPLPVFLAGSIFGILFYHGLAYIALTIDIEKADPVFHYYGIGFALGALTAMVIMILAASIKSPCFRTKTEVPELSQNIINQEV
jgi:hypothetical protein